jgi:hypothetical protein
MLGKSRGGVRIHSPPDVHSGLPEELEIEPEEVLMEDRVEVDQEDGESRGHQGLEPQRTPEHAKQDQDAGHEGDISETIND